MNKADLKLDWCSHAAAKYAVEHWHYSKSLPPSGRVYLGAWERHRFVGAVVFGNGSTNNVTNGKRFGLSEHHEVAELCRVALGDHSSPVSRILRIAIKMLTRQSPGIRLLISYADPHHGHVGNIYQAGNWLYLGTATSRSVYTLPSGEQKHSREVSADGTAMYFGRRTTVPKFSDCVVTRIPPKHRYVYPLDLELRERLMTMAQPYPKRAGSIAADAPAFQAGEGGSSPTPALQPLKVAAERSGK